MPNDFIPCCPVCGHQLVVRQLACPDCKLMLQAELSLPPLSRLPAELQRVAIVFLRCRGNFREVEAELGISYPTVSKKLDALNVFLEAIGAGEDSNQARILRQLEAGELGVKDAVELIKKEATSS